jgi:two-component system, OmpR family, response regulator
MELFSFRLNRNGGLAFVLTFFLTRTGARIAGKRSGAVIRGHAIKVAAFRLQPWNWTERHWSGCRDMQKPAHILIVDDDLETRKLLGRYLTDQGYRVSLASDQRTTKEALLIGEVSLIVLDVLLPDGSGLDVCRDLRREGSDIPVIILTALKEDVDRIIGLEIGADDYLGKPLNPRELLARIRAVLRRRLTQEIQLSQVLEHRFGKFKLYPGVRKVLDEAELPLDLTAAEFELLLAMVRRPGRLLTRDFSN